MNPLTINDVRLEVDFRVRLRSYYTKEQGPFFAIIRVRWFHYTAAEIAEGVDTEDAEKFRSTCPYFTDLVEEALMKLNRDVFAGLKVSVKV